MLLQANLCANRPTQTSGARMVSARADGNAQTTSWPPNMTQPTPWMMIPFGLLLTLIAVGPLFFADWWGRHYPKVSFGLGAVAVLYYLLGLHAGERVAEVMFDYVRFFALIG